MVDPATATGDPAPRRVPAREPRPAAVMSGPRHALLQPPRNPPAGVDRSADTTADLIGSGHASTSTAAAARPGRAGAPPGTAPPAETARPACHRPQHQRCLRSAAIRPGTRCGGTGRRTPEPLPTAPADGPSPDPACGAPPGSPTAGRRSFQHAGGEGVSVDRSQDCPAARRRDHRAADAGRAGLRWPSAARPRVRCRWWRGRGLLGGGDGGSGVAAARRGGRSRAGARSPPAGVPHPLHRGWVPISWWTPVTAAGPHWRMLHGDRRRETASPCSLHPLAAVYRQGAAV